MPIGSILGKQGETGRGKQGTDHVLFWFGKLTRLLKTLTIKRGPSPISATSDFRYPQG